jgi:hypothetical protein
MTIATENIRNDYIGNGSNDTFPYTYKAFEDTDLQVYVDGVLQTLTTDYTVSGAGSESGGDVVFVTPPSNGLAVAIVADVAYTQETDLVNETGFFQDRIESALDKNTRQSQILDEKASRAIHLPVDEAGSELLTTLPPLDERKGRNLSFDATTGQPTATAPASAAVSAAMEPVVGAATLDLARQAMGAGNFVSALDFDGIDPTGATDSTDAIRAAYAAAKAANKNMYLPAGTYLMNGDASYDEDEFGLLYCATTSAGIIGDGSGVTTIKCGSATAGGIRFSGATGVVVRGISIDMDGGTGFGLYFGGQYSRVQDVKISGIGGTRGDDTEINGIALCIPASTLCAFDDITIMDCANGVYCGFSGAELSAPCQYLTFNRLNTDPSKDGFSIRVKYGNTVAFNDAYVEGAPERVIDIISSVGVYFRNLSAEIVGDYPLTTDSHFLSTASQNVMFDGVRILYSTGAPADKNIWELGGAGELITFKDVLVQIREDIRDVIETTATQDQVQINGLYVKPVVGGKTCDTITSGAFYNLNARCIQGAPFKPTGSHVHVTSAFCDVYCTTGATSVIHAEVGTSDWKIYADTLEVTGARVFDYVPSASNHTAQGGKHIAEYFEVGSYFLFGNGMSIKWTSAATPEGAVTATPGSLCISNNGGGGTLWQKTSGTGNTGWTQIT